MVLGVLLVTSVFTTAGFAGAPSVSATFPGTNGKIAFTGANSNSTTHSLSPSKIYTINSDGTGLAKLADNDFPERLSRWSPDGSKIVFMGGDYRPNSTSGKAIPDFALYVINSDGTGQVQLTTTGLNFNTFEWSPDGTKIAYSLTIPDGTTRNDDNVVDIYAVNADGSGTIKLTDTDANVAPSFRWSPDGNRIAYVLRCTIPPSSSCPGDIYVADADGSESINLTQFSDNQFAGTGLPVWSPDGTRIAFDHTDGGLGSAGLTTDIYAVNADGSGSGGIRLTNNAIGEASVEPQWSLDGEKLVFTQGFTDRPDKESMIYMMDSIGNNKVNLTGDTENFSSGAPLFSPDGTKILFSGTLNATSNYNYYVMNADGSNKVNIAKKGQNEFLNHAPVWSPDSTRLTFSLHPNDAEFITEFAYVVNADGTGKIRLTGDDENAIESKSDWGVRQELPSPEAKLEIETVDLSGDPVSGVWTTIRQLNGTLVRSGYTPFTFIAESGMQYKITVANYDGKEFVKWDDDDGSSSRTRTLGLSTDTALTAVYNTGDALRGFTSLTYTGTVEQPDMTINALSLDGSKTLHMWAIIDPQSSDESGTTYKVYATNGYQNLTFDHWEDGSTDSIRTLALTENATIVAYYSMGAMATSTIPPG